MMVLYTYYKKRRSNFMREDDNLEIIENISSLTSMTTTATTTTPADSKEIKKDDFNLNSQYITPNCHNSSFFQDSEFYLIKYNIPLRPKIKQIQYRINNETIKLQTIFNEL